VVQIITWNWPFFSFFSFFLSLGQASRFLCNPPARWRLPCSRMAEKADERGPHPSEVTGPLPWHRPDLFSHSSSAGRRYFFVGNLRAQRQVGCRAPVLPFSPRASPSRVGNSPPPFLRLKVIVTAPPTPRRAFLRRIQGACPGRPLTPGPFGPSAILTGLCSPGKGCGPLRLPPGRHRRLRAPRLRTPNPSFFSLSTPVSAL